MSIAKLEPDSAKELLPVPLNTIPIHEDLRCRIATRSRSGEFLIYLNLELQACISQTQNSPNAGPALS